MEHLIEVAFKGNRREFFRWSFEAPPQLRAAIIVEVERGEDIGHVHATGELAERRKAGTTHGKEQREPLRAALRLASIEEIARADGLRTDEETARRYAVQKARALNLQMKVSDAEWQWDRRRLTFYFTAEERVDFRALVRQLESHFGVRVQMWHIGPRDEAKRLDGVGHCGRQLCSAAWLPELLPVKTSLAKEQRLSTITPTQISGACGRLMCCLRYEHEFYVAARKRFPKQGKIVQTLQGDEKIESTDIFRDLVHLRNPAGDTRAITLAQFRRELAGETMPVDDDVREGDDETADEGEERLIVDSIRAQDTVQLQRPNAQSARTQERPQAPRPPRAESRAEPRSEPRAETRAEPRAEPRTERRTEDRPEKRAEPRREQRPEPRRDNRDQRPAARPSGRPEPRPEQPRAPRPDARPPVAPAPAAARDAQAVPPTPPSVATPPLTPLNAAEEAEQHRSRRRRGRRGGRRHRGDGNHPGNNGGAPGAPPSQTDR